MAKAKELSFFEILSSSWKFFSENFLQIMAIALIIYLPIDLVSAAEQSLHTRDIDGNKLSDYIPPVSTLLEFFIGIIATMAIALFVKTKTSGKKIDFKAALLAAIKKWPVAIGTNLLLSLFLLGLFLLLVVPGIYFSVYWAFTILAVILSDKKYKGAMDYSKSLVQGRWWKTFGILFGLGIIVMIAISLVGLPLSYLPGSLLGNFLSKTLVSVAASFFAVATTIVYLNFEKTQASKHV